MSLTSIQIEAQPKTDCRALLESAENHVRAATRITDIGDLRYFTMSNLQEVRINLHLALELLALLKQK